MTSAAPGICTSPVEVTNISRHGFWLLFEKTELFLLFSEFPCDAIEPPLRFFPITA